MRRKLASGLNMVQPLIAIVITLTLASTSALAQTRKYEMDKSHTIVDFSWNHNRLSNMSGRFMAYDGQFDLDFDRPSNSQVRFTIEADSIWTGIDKLDKDMRSERLFDVEKFPQITFISTKARKTGLERGQLEGDLTIKGITHKVRLDIEVNYQGPHIFADSVEKYKHALQAGLSLRTRINRSDFDLSMAVPWIADEIDIHIETEMVSFAQPPETATPE